MPEKYHGGPVYLPAGRRLVEPVDESKYLKCNYGNKNIRRKHGKEYHVEIDPGHPTEPRCG
jgi:hypothetical protein